MRELVRKTKMEQTKTHRPREAIVQHKPKLCHVESNVLVDAVQYEFGDATIRVAAMHEQKACKEAELCYRIVTAACSLKAFVATDTHTYVKRTRQIK